MADLEASPLDRAWSGVTGLFSPGSAEIDPNTGISEQMRKQAMFNTFGNVGALLMAAGQKQMPAQRAQILAQMGQASTGPQEMMLKQAQLMQMNLYRNAQVQKLKMEMDQQKAWQKLMEGVTGQGATPAPQGAAAAPQAEGVPLPGAPSSPMMLPASALAGAPAQGAMPGPLSFAPPATAMVSPQQALARPPLPTPVGTPPGPTLNSPTIPNIVQNMDPMTRAAVGVLGAQKGGELLANETFARGRQNTDIENQRYLQDQRLAADKARQNETMASEVVQIPVTGADGIVRTVPVQKSQVPAFMANNGAQVGKPEYNHEQTKQLEGLGDLYTKLQEGRTSAAELNGRLSQMETAAAGFEPGKGAGKYYDAAAWLNSTLPGAFLPDGFGPDKVSSYQEFTKLATQYATEQARKLGAREAASVVNMMVQANPNADLTPDTLRRMMGGLRAQNDYAVEKANAADAWLADPKNRNSLRGFENDFIKKNPTEKFLMPYLTKDDLAHIPTPVLKRMMGQ
jgi:hypothetical protein